MASPASLTIGFTHTSHSQPPLSLGLPIASYFIRELGFLAIGYTSGVIALFEISDDGSRQHLRTYLNGHKSPIVAFESLATRSPKGDNETVLLSLSLDGRICKWDALDGLCLQTSDASLDARPRGLVVIKAPAVNSEGRTLDLNWLTDFFVIVYGCTTSATVLSFTTLSVVTLWTGHQDWPIVLTSPDSSQRTIFTVEKIGGVKAWEVVKKPLGRIEFSKSMGTPFPATDLKLGNIISAGFIENGSEDHSFKLVVGRLKGLCVFEYIQTDKISLQYLKSTDSTPEIKDNLIAGSQIFCFSRDGCILLHDAELDELGGLSPPKSPEYRVVYYTVTNSRSGMVRITAFTVWNDGSNDFIMGVRRSGESEFQWNEALQKSPAASDDGNMPSKSTASALFEYNFVYALGRTLNFYTLDQYLMDFSSPTHSIELPNCGDQISILQTVQLGKTAASEERSYLIVGLVDGSIYVVEPASFRLSGCLSLHSNPISGAVVLPSDLAPRIRSTLLVYSNNGSASIIDIMPAISESSSFKARILMNLPSGMSPRKLDCVATQKSKSLLLIIDTDGRKRLWDVDAAEGGALVNDTDSPPRSPVNTRDGHNFESLDSSQEPWREHRLDASSGAPSTSKSIVHDGKVPSAHGYPTATVDVFGVIRYLYKSSKDSEKEQLLAPDDEVLYPARSLLTVLVDSIGLMDDSLDTSFNISKETGLELSQLIVDGYKSQISLAQVGKDGNVSIIMNTRSDNKSPPWETMSPRTRSQILLSICTLIYTILHLTTAAEAFTDSEELLKRAIVTILSKEREENEIRLDLALLSEFWADSNPWIRASCRALLDAELSLLTKDDVKATIEYWQDFLPTQISPELFSLTDVLRSVAVLCVLIISLDANNGPEKFRVDRGLRRNVALSIELFLTDNDRVYQDIAIDLVSEGWPSWQSEFDAFEVIHVLMRILASPNLSAERMKRINSAFIKIAEKNAPLLASGIANCISHASPEKGIAVTTLTELINLSIAAKKTVVSIVRADPHLFAEPELIKVIMDAIVKILDPQGGQIRERVLQHVSEVVNEVVDAYPTVAFHRPTQKLAVSSSPRAITIYDLNTAKAVASLEGHTKTAQFLTFSQDGKTIVAADLDESQLLVWKMAVSIFSSFIGAAANIKALGVEGVGVIMVKSKHSFKNPKGVGMVRVEFASEKSVNVTAGADVTSLSV